MYLVGNNNISKPITIDLILGVCVKDAQGKVLSQNEKCKNICGSRINEICKDGCMKDYTLRDESEVLVEAPKTINNVQGLEQVCDAVVINSGSNIITFLFSRQEQIEAELLMFKKFGLTKMEQSVARMLLEGLTNKEIAERLFISVATIKTHINNLYRKLPATLKQRIISLRK